MNTLEYRLGIWIARHNLRISAAVYALTLIVIGAVIALASPRADAQTAPTGTLAVSPKTLTGAGNVTVTWNVANGSNCVASGLWSGAKAASGSQVVPVTASGSFSLKCDGPAPTVIIGWTLPTKNTDGSNLTDLAASKVYRAASAAGPFSLLTTVNVPGNSHTSTTLPAGPNYFTVTALNAAGAESSQSAMVNTTVPALASATFSDAVTVSTIPNPPTNLAVTIATLAYELRQYSGGTLRFVSVGTVDKGVACPGAKLVGDFRAFDGAKITKPTTGGIIAAKCG